MRERWKDYVIAIIQIIGLLAFIYGVIYFFEHMNEIIHIKVR